ncbi:MAG: hypothetical protein IT495_18190 [Gammaproteobacteria bacterium]|nr:hypothetical protein [Gammaproteobacteria bacterium]
MNETLEALVLPDGGLLNRVDYGDAIAPWTFGVTELIRCLQARGLRV